MAPSPNPHSGAGAGRKVTIITHGWIFFLSVTIRIQQADTWVIKGFLYEVAFHFNFHLMIFSKL